MTQREKRMAELRELSEETAEALLTKIKAEAQRTTGSTLENLANAYATVVGAMPRKSAGGRSATVG